MEFEFHPDQWLAIFANYPVVTVLFGGLVGGVAITQTLKMLYLAFSPGRLPLRQQTALIRVVATCTTFFFTNSLWLGLIPVSYSGLHWVVSAVAGAAAPSTYSLAKALVGWKFPDFASKWGDSER